jgi:hypothetical protein
MWLAWNGWYHVTIRGSKHHWRSSTRFKTSPYKYLNIILTLHLREHLTTRKKSHEWRHKSLNWINVKLLQTIHNFCQQRCRKFAALALAVPCSSGWQSAVNKGRGGDTPPAPHMAQLYTITCTKKKQIYIYGNLRKKICTTTYYNNKYATFLSNELWCTDEESISHYNLSKQCCIISFDVNCRWKEKLLKKSFGWFA